MFACACVHMSHAQLIFPEGNRADYEELASDLKEGITPHFCTHYDEVFKLALEYDGPITPKPAPPPKDEKASKQ